MQPFKRMLTGIQRVTDYHPDCDNNCEECSEEKRSECELWLNMEHQRLIE